LFKLRDCCVFRYAEGCERRRISAALMTSTLQELRSLVIPSSFVIRTSSFFWLVPKIRGQAFFDLGNRRACARGIVFYLVARDFTDPEIFRFRMRKIKSAHTRTWMHRERFRELDAEVFLRLEQTEQRTFLRMIVTRRITGGGSNSAISFAKQILQHQVFAAPKSPRLARKLVGIFGERFR